MPNTEIRKLILKVSYILLWVVLLIIDTYFLVETFWR